MYPDTPRIPRVCSRAPPAYLGYVPGYSQGVSNIEPGYPQSVSGMFPGISGMFPVTPRVSRVCIRLPPGNVEYVPGCPQSIQPSKRTLEMFCVLCCVLVSVVPAVCVCIFCYSSFCVFCVFVRGFLRFLVSVVVCTAGGGLFYDSLISVSVSLRSVCVLCGFSSCCASWR